MWARDQPLVCPGAQTAGPHGAAPFCSLVPRTKTGFVTDRQFSITNNLVSNKFPEQVNAAIVE